MTSDEFRAAARQRIANESIGGLQVDDRSEVQPVADGAYVSCWMWVEPRNVVE